MPTDTLESPTAGAPGLFTPEWLTLPQACQRSNLGKTTLYALIKSGDLKSKVFKTRRDNISGKRMILAASLDSYLSA